MPLKSKEQQRFLFARKPKLAKEFAKKTKSFKNLLETAALSRGFQAEKRFVNLPETDALSRGFQAEKRFSNLPETAALQPPVYIAPNRLIKPDFNKAENRKQAREFADMPMKIHLADSFDMARKNIHKHAKEDPAAAINGLIDVNIKEHGSKKEKKMLGMADSSSASTVALFKEDLPKKLELGEHFIRKDLDEKTGKFHYVYPKDIERQQRRTAKQSLKASKTGDIPEKFKLSNIVKTADTKSKVESADMNEKRQGDYKGGVSGRTWSWDKHEYKARAGPKGEYQYNYAKNKGVSLGDALASRDQQTQQQRELAQQEKVPKQNQVPASTMQGAGLHTQMQGAGNPVNQGQVMAPAKQAMQSMVQNTMVDQAKAQGNIYDSRALGQDNFAKQDSSLNPLSPQNLTPEQQQRFGECHEVSKQMAFKTGGVRHTTTGRNAGAHSITINPDNTVYDYVLGINGMPVERYLSLVPYSFAANP